MNHAIALLKQKWRQEKRKRSKTNEEQLQSTLEAFEEELINNAEQSKKRRKQKTTEEQ